MAKGHTSSSSLQSTGSMTLSEARKLAATEKLNWCIMPLGIDLAVGRMELEEEIRVVPICCEKGNTLRFPSIPSARDFLRRQLAVSRSMLFPA